MMRSILEMPRSFFVPYSLYIPLLMCCLIAIACGASEEDRSPEQTNQNGNSDQSESQILLIDRKADIPDTEWEPLYDYEIRGAFIQINPVFFQSNQPGEGTKLLLNFFEDSAYEAEIIQVRNVIEGVTSTTGRISSEPNAWFTLNVEEKRVLATFRFPRSGKQYTIYYLEDPGCHIIAEVDPEKLDILPGDPPPITPDTL